MKRKIAFYGNNSRLGEFLLKKWCAKNYKKYEIHLIFDNKNESNNLSKISKAESIILLNRDLIKILVEKNISDIFLLEPSKLLSNSYKKENFVENNISIYIENTDFLKTHLDKYLSNLSLEKNNLPIPKFQLLSEFILNPKIDFPIIIKPNRGYASKNIIFLNNERELYEKLNKHIKQENFIVQEVLKGKEYSCTIVKNVDLKYMSIERKSINEYTVSSEFKNKYNFHLKKWIPNIGNLGFEYALNIQYILTENGPKIFEINPRLGTAETHRFEYSFDAIDLLLTSSIKSTKYKEGSYSINNLI
ncbi:hypothetical protein DI383_14260 [Flavobacteriaceae bacterium LYZ1037]|nr:hypothetical protein DI383_14260 [Flavobacteriaceae bacterium LYZ1037]